MSRTLFLLAAAAFITGIVAVLPGCSDGITVDYETSTDSTVKPSELTTYRWMPTPENKPLDKRLTDDYDDVIRQAVNKELAAKGYVLTNDPTASFQVIEHVVIKEEVETKVINEYCGYCEDSRIVMYTGDQPATETVKRKYEEGSLILDFSIPNKSHLYWRGTASAEIHPNQPKDKRDAQIRKAVKLILQKFPAKK